MTAAQKIAKDPNQMSLEFDREIDIEAEVIVPGNDPVYDIVAKLNEREGTDWKTLDQTYQLKRIAQTANNKSEFDAFANTFYKNKFTPEQLQEIYFNASGITKQDTKMFITFSTRTEVEATSKKTNKPTKVIVRDYVNEIKDTPKFGQNGESLDLSSTGTFHNRLNKDSSFETILHITGEYGTNEPARMNRTTVNQSQLEQISAHLQEQYGRFIYYQHSSNHSLVARPIVELPFQRQLLDRFIKDGGGQLYGGPGKNKEHIFASTSVMETRETAQGRTVRTDKLKLIEGIKEK